jgi:pilus assembly protein FimV
MRTAVRRVLLMSALMSPGVLQALGLGDIRLSSALNQPFDAEIELIAATQEDLGALRASLASGDTFTRYGLDRPSYLSDFTFRVTKGADGKDVLRVTSPRPVTEPFVTLLVEANWPRGRLLREYTVLLDPPVYAPAQSSSPEAAVAAPRVTSGGATSARAPATESVVSETTAAPRSQVRAPAPVAARVVEPGSTYTVRPNDTLWKIASAAHPGSRSDVNRAMVSIYQNNAGAFDGNINVLRSGSTLRIPQSTEVASVSSAAAAAEVARQYEDWRNGRATPPASTGAADAGRLRLVTPEQGTAAPSTATTAPAVTAATSVDARVKQLEAELAEARRLLEVRNAELATLQGGVAAPVEAPVEAEVTESTVSEPAPASGEAAESEAAAAPAEALPAPAPAAEATPPPKAAAPAEPAGPTLLERAMEYWWALLALLAVIGGVLLFKRLRGERGAAEADLEDALARDIRSQARSTATPRPRDNGILVEEKRAVDSQRLANPVTATASPIRAPEPTRKPVAVDDTLSGEGPASMESGDPLAEADFHMAYGLYDQAADLVQLAMKREPKRRDLKLKLLEIFFVWGNKDRFLQLAKEMNASRAEAPSGEWDKILIMGKQIAPDDAMFSGALRSSSEALDLELHSATSTIDMSLFPGENTLPDLDLSSGAAEPSRADSSGIDFILDEPVRGSDEDPTAGPTVETPQVHSRRVHEDTEELPVDKLGLDISALRGLESLDDAGDPFIARKGKRDTAEEDTAANLVIIEGDAELDVDLDMIGSTALIKMGEDTAHMLRVASEEQEAGVIDLSDATGSLPMIDPVELGHEMHPSGVDFDIGGEPATMSEVGTKLDLARAYMDMGDPEGARSILDEVLGEGNAAQRQEAERLIGSLP